MLNNLLRGGVLGNALAKTSALAEGGQTIDSIMVTGDHWIDWTVSNDKTSRNVRTFVSSETKDLLNANMGALATNVIRAITAVNSLKEFPEKSTTMGLTGSVTLQGSATMNATGTGGTVGGSIQMGGSYSATYDSTDGVMRALREANEAIRINTSRAISGYSIAVPNADAKIPDVMKALGDVPADDANNLALSLVNRAAERANQIAQDVYRKNAPPGKTIPSEFNNWLTGVKVF